MQWIYADHLVRPRELKVAEQRADGPRQDELPPLRRDPAGRDMGYEYSRVLRDTFDVSVDDEIERMLCQHPVAVLDVGAASGFRAEQLARLGANVTAIDFENARHEVTARNPGLTEKGWAEITFRSADITDPDFTLREASYDMIHARCVLHFMNPFELEDVMRRLAEGLCPGGMFAGMMLTQCPSLENALTTPDRWGGRCDPSGYWLHHFDTVHELLHENGMEMKDLLVHTYPHRSPRSGQSVYAFMARKQPEPC